jgi:hypothetical protein
MELLQYIKPQKPPPVYTVYDTALQNLLELKDIERLNKNNGSNNSNIRKIPWERKKTKFRDWLFIPIFLLVVAIFFCIAYKSIENVYLLHQQNLELIWKGFINRYDFNEVGLSNIFLLCILVIFAAFLCGFVQLIGLLIFYKGFIVSSIIINCSLGVYLSIYFYQHQKWYLMVVIITFTLIVLIIAFKMHKKIAFNAQVIRIGSRMLRKSPSIWVTYMCMLTLNSFFMLFYFIVLFASFVIWKEEQDLQLKYGIFAFLVFVGYYLSEMFQNATQVIIGSIVAKWYFQSNVDTNIAIYNTFFKGFGSICIGSLFASILSVCKEMVILIEPNNQFLKYPLMKPIWRLIEWTSGALDYTIQYFNQYAYAFIAINSCGYFTSSYKMLQIYNLKGYDTLISECIIKLILLLYIIFSGITGAFVAYECIKILEPSYIQDRQYLWILLGISSLLAMQISRLISLIINAYIHVFFLCLIQHREVLICTHPDEYICIEKYLPAQPPICV